MQTKMMMRRRLVTFVQTQGRASATESSQTMQRAFLVRKGVKKRIFRTLSLTNERWGSKVLNFIVKTHIQLFVLTAVTRRNEYFSDTMQN